MATLTLARADIGFDARLAGAIALSDWLDGRWGLIFSHPQDFAAQGLEADRWRSLVAEALETMQVRPLRLQSLEQRYASWIEQIAEGDQLLALERRKRVSSDDLSARAAALRSVLSRSTERFVAIVDERMQLRHVFVYSAAHRIPCVFDVIALVDVLREEVLVEPRAAQANAKVIDLPLRGRAAGLVAQLPLRRVLAY